MSLNLEQTKAKMDFNQISTEITASTFKVANYAKANGLNVKFVKQSLSDHFGANIVFKRGRNGGVSFVQTGVSN
jgi:hypothetical protein